MTRPVRPLPPPSRLPGEAGATRVAVIGSGISGLTAAYLLGRRDHVTLYEAQDRLGGHTHTHTVPVGEGGSVRVDSGFIVHNDRTYPLLRRLFRELGIATRDTEMSMSVRAEEAGIEYAGGRGLKGFLARPGQLARRDYVSMLLAVRRFHADARAYLARTDDADTTTYGEFIAAGSYPASFTELYAVPLVACVWSSGPGDALDYPARYLFRFLANHGMLTVGDSPQWMTVVGGSATYVEAIARQLPAVRSGAAVTGIARDDDGVTVTDAAGGSLRYDRVVVATHADEALALLTDAGPLEKEVLGAFRYSRNETILHRDPRLLPRARLARSSWNYLVPGTPARDDRTPGAVGRPGSDEPAHDQGGNGQGPVVTYWMNRLQGLPEEHPLLVTLGGRDLIDEEAVIAVMDYAHPIYDLAAVSAQRRLPELNTDRVAFAGAYHGWGFHEDGCRSGVEAARAFGVEW